MKNISYKQLQGIFVSNILNMILASQGIIKPTTPTPSVESFVESFGKLTTKNVPLSMKHSLQKLTKFLWKIDVSRYFISGEKIPVTTY